MPSIYEDDRRKHMKSAEYNDVHAPKPDVDDRARKIMRKRDAKRYGQAGYSIVPFFIAIVLVIAFLAFPATDEVLPAIWVGIWGLDNASGGFLYAVFLLGGVFGMTAVFMVGWHMVASSEKRDEYLRTCSDMYDENGVLFVQHWYKGMRRPKGYREWYETEIRRRYDRGTG